MKTKQSSPNPILILFLLLLIPIAVIMFALYSNPKPPKPECYQDEVQSMTIQAVSNLLNLKLAEITWLPNTRDIPTPKITTRDNNYVYGSEPDCNITIKYPDPNSPDHSFVTIDVDGISGLQLTQTPLQCSWNFTNDARPTGSQCRFDLDNLSSTLALSVAIDPAFSPEEVIQILDGMRVVEPISGTNGS